jgi:hypothetical protein
MMRNKWMMAGAMTALAGGMSFGQDVVFTQALPAPPPGAEAGVVMFSNRVEMPGQMQFLSAEMSVDGAVVKGSPYSADAVTETTQTLSDGNRITHKSTASLYRDGEGRTRREQAFPAIGPWATSGTPPVSVFINDPVAGVNYVLESDTKTARKLPTGKMAMGAGMPMAGTVSAAGGETIDFKGNASGAVQYKRKMARALPATDAKQETLPKQMIEGVMADGTRSTITIPAGEMGNEQAILVVSERWYSPELKMVLMTKHSDPRMGETVYRLTRLQRAEPAHSLFEVPADYTVKEDMPGPRMMIHTIEKNGVETTKE